MSMLNCTSISILLAMIYAFYSGYKIYQMMNPMRGIEITGISIDSDPRR